MNEPIAPDKLDRPPDYKGRSICFYHPNRKGTGSALRIEPRVNRHGEDRYNCFFMELAMQQTTAQRKGDTHNYATFDWANKITVKLGFLDVSELLLVLEGRLPQVGGSRNGLYHASGQGNTLIGFTRHEERAAYCLSVSRKGAEQATPVRMAIHLSDVEAMGLRCLFQTGLFFVTFPSALRRSGNEFDGCGMIGNSAHETRERVESGV